MVAMNKALEKFVKSQGSAAIAAESLGVTVGAVRHWRNGTNGMSNKTAKKIEAVTRGKIKAAALVFGDN